MALSLLKNHCSCISLIFTGKAMHFYGLISKLMVLLIKEETYRTNLHLLYEKRIKILFYYVVDRDVDILAVTETWLKADERRDNIIRDVTPTGHTFVHSLRLNGISRGVGMLYRTNLKVQQLSSESYKSFEF